MIWIVIAVIVVDLGIGLAIVWGFIHFGWGNFARPFPRVDAPVEAVSRNFQSFRLGVLNLGFAIHVKVDEVHLHLRPVRVMRWLGARPASIPWDQVSIVKRSRSGNWITATIGSHKLQGPAWCLSLAEPETQADTRASSA